MTEIEKLQDDVKRLSEHVSNLQRAVLWLCQDVERSGHNLDVSRVRALVSNEVRDDGQRYRVPMNESPCEGPDEASPPPYTVHPVRSVIDAGSPERAEKIAAAAKAHALATSVAVRGCSVFVDFATSSFDEVSAAEDEIFQASGEK